MANSISTRHFICDKCDKKFVRISYLIRHILKHERDQFSCDKCSKSFTQKVHLRTHMLIHDPNLKYRFTCNVCEKNFTQKGNLKRHIISIHKMWTRQRRSTTMSVFQATYFLD